MNTAQIILHQLGSNRFVTMTGARNLTDFGNGLSFAVGRNIGKVTHVRIELDPSDTYTVQFLNIRKTTIKTIAERDMVYADSLRQVFENVTGMRTAL